MRADTSERTDGTFARSGFEWDKDNDRYTCPEGQHLLQSRRNASDPRRKEPKTGRRRYRATKAACDACPSKPECCPNTNPRFIGRAEHEDARDFARLAAKTPFDPKAQAKRKQVEMLFAHRKRILGPGRLRLPGPCGVKDEFTLAAIARTLRNLAKPSPRTHETRTATGSEPAKPKPNTPPAATVAPETLRPTPQDGKPPKSWQLLQQNKTAQTTRSTLRNNTRFPYGIQLQGCRFFDVEADGEMATDRDTTLIVSGETRDILCVFDNSGICMLHCHMYGRKAAGMMAWTWVG